MSIEGWYYLHTNGSLIYKRELGETAADIRESDFAVSMWPCDPNDRENCWRILVESRSLGADTARIKELSEKWFCDDEDAAIYAQRIGVTLEIDGNSWCAKCAKISKIKSMMDQECGLWRKCLNQEKKLNLF